MKTGHATETLVVDTVAPRLVSLALDPQTGQLTITLEDDGSELDPARLIPLTDVRLGRSMAHPNLPVTVTGLTVVPGGRSGTESVVATINGGKRLPAGRYPLTISPGAVVDRAGNAWSGLNVVLVAYPRRGVIESGAVRVIPPRVAGKAVMPKTSTQRL
jgi:hypothetical protein